MAGKSALSARLRARRDRRRRILSAVRAKQDTVAGLAERLALEPRIVRFYLGELHSRGDVRIADYTEQNVAVWAYNTTTP